MGTARTIARNFLSLTAANVVAKVFGLVAVVYLARRLGPGDFGLANSALASVGYFSILAHLGINVIATRDLAQGRVDRSLYISNIISLKFALGAAAFGLLALLAVFSPDDRPDFKTLLLIYGLTIFTTNVLPADWVFLSAEEMGHPAIASAGTAALYAALALLLVSGPENLTLMPCALLTAQAAGTVYLFYRMKKRFPDVRLGFNLSLALQVLKETAPLGLAGLLAVVVSNTGLSLLGFISAPEEAGYFSAAGKISGIFSEALMAYSVVILPPIARHYVTGREKVEKLISYTFKGLALLGMPAAAGICVLAPAITALIFDGRFAPAAPVLSLLIWNFILLFGASTLYYVLVSAGRQRRLLYITAIQAAATLVMSAVLIKTHGALGAGLAALLTGLLTLTLFVSESRPFLTFSLRDAFLKPSLGAAAMALAIFPLRDHPLLLTIPLGAAVYSAAIWGLRAVTKEDAAALKSLFQGDAA